MWRGLVKRCDVMETDKEEDDNAEEFEQLETDEEET